MTIQLNQIRGLHGKLFSTLYTYKPPYIAQAPARITQKIGRLDDQGKATSLYPYLEKVHWLNHTQHQFHLSPVAYTCLHTAMKLFANNLAGKKVLEPACNYGGFLHFLKYQEKAEVSGVDIFEEAAEYARENGLDVKTASATDLPFDNDEFDLVLTRQFLDNNYLDPGMIPPIIKEISRVLKPGGIYISDLEDACNSSDFDTAPFSLKIPFSEEAARAHIGFKFIRIFVN